MNITVGECTENRLNEAMALARRCFQKTENHRQSRQGREALARRLWNNRALREQVERGEIRLFAAFDGDRLCGLCLMQENHIEHFCIDARYRRTDAAPLLLDFIRLSYPEMTAWIFPTDIGLLQDCGFIEEQTVEQGGLTLVAMRAPVRALTHEIWDLRDEIGEPTGRYASRVQYRDLRSGEYMLAVHVFLYTPNGRFLIQKRSMKKDVLPGVWDMTGGAAKAGEDGQSAAIRETREEVGLSLSPTQMHLAVRLKRKRSFVEIWFAELSIDLRRCVLQDGEVDEVKLVSRKEMIDLIDKSKHRDGIYKKSVIGALRDIT